MPGTNTLVPRYTSALQLPELTFLLHCQITTLYTSLRQAAQATGSIPITVRYLDSLLRVAQSHARMHLRENVLQADVDMVLYYPLLPLN